jgi:Rrf2 family protein
VGTHLSTRGKYGVKAMFELSRQAKCGPVSLKTIARNQGLSEHYLEQLVGPLRRAGLITSARGSRGGYLLGREAAEITVADIIRVLEGPIVPCDCVSGDASVHHCGAPGGCVAKGVWEMVRDSVAALLDSITLEDLALAKESSGVPGTG